jgi:formamidopyrimidine-DNA glycosylase
VERADILRGITAAAFSRRLRQATVEQVHRRAKSVVLDLAPAMHLVVTPRFTGALLLDRPPEDYTSLAVALADGRQLRYRDIRRLGTVQLLDPRKFAAWSDALGPEPLDPSLTPERFSGILRGSARAVKTILMDQRKLAGVGNIYANEACWRAEVRPARRGVALLFASGRDDRDKNQDRKTGHGEAHRCMGRSRPPGRNSFDLAACRQARWGLELGHAHSLVALHITVGNQS